MELIISLVFILYCILVLWLIAGWHQSISNKQVLNRTKLSVTVVIAIRNEAGNVLNLINDLMHQTYEQANFVLIDDHSDDGTVEIIQDALKKRTSLDNRFKLLTSEGIGKKAALSLGIEHAKGEIIITTDADCRLQKEWIEKMVENFLDSTQMVVGTVKITAVNFFSRLQQLEFASLIGSGAATLAFGLPTMANGANLAFRKSAFESVFGYTGNDHIASGDDEFLLRKIFNHFGGGIRFCHQSQTIVTTSHQPTLASFIAQRVRWASKWNLHKGLFSKLLAVLICLCQCIFLLTPWLGIFDVLQRENVLVLLGSKALVELLFFILLIRQMQIKFSPIAFLVLQLLYPYYVVAIAFLSLQQKYVWKGRHF